MGLGLAYLLNKLFFTMTLPEAYSTIFAEMEIYRHFRPTEKDTRKFIRTSLVNKTHTLSMGLAKMAL